MCQFVRRFAVIGQENHTFGHIIEAADVCHAGAVFDQVEHSPSPGRIGASCQHAGGFVENDPPGVRRLLYRLSVDQDFVTYGIYGLSNHGDASVYSDAAGCDQLLRSATRGDSGARDGALNPHSFGHQSARTQFVCYRGSSEIHPCKRIPLRRPNQKFR